MNKREEKISMKNALKAHKDKNMDTKKNSEIKNTYLDMHHCSKVDNEDDEKVITCTMCPAQPSSKYIFSDPKSTTYQDINNDPQRKNNLKARTRIAIVRV